jgi:hypothetical protein
MSSPSPDRRRGNGRSLLLRLYASRRWKSVLLGLAALPLFQTSGCYPDLLAGLSYQLQMLVNNFVINAANIIIQNILGL